MNRRKARLIPVLDVMNGQVVRAIGGRRNEYQPIRSGLVQSTDPQTVATAMLEATGASELYIADLDAIQARTSLSDGVRELLESTSVTVWLDAGFGSWHDIVRLPALSLVRPVVGFETCRTPAQLDLPAEALHDVVFCPPRFRHIGFSIDLRDGELIGDWRSWGLRDERDALGLARVNAQMMCRHLIVLDLARVGKGSGCGTNDLLRAIRAEFPTIELMAGGGVKNWDDIERLEECGVDAVLVASAIHDGSVKTRPDFQ